MGHQIPAFAFSRPVICPWVVLVCLLLPSFRDSSPARKKARRGTDPPHGSSGQLRSRLGLHTPHHQAGIPFGHWTRTSTRRVHPAAGSKAADAAALRALPIPERILLPRFPGFQVSRFPFFFAPSWFHTGSSWRASLEICPDFLLFRRRHMQSQRLCRPRFCVEWK
jgi:hypothetical protein